ncbi:MAG: methylglyoxal synthase [Actinobacteria bacterium RBG_19FT_COMBO_70_19]|jgi:methylglyoxal synthase|nr:MAG: methylglyoxal synthase [Actinobacteria bacterium RBG_19FT_COMBO_70_19]
MADRPYTLALIAHDGKKDDLLRFAKDHLDLLRRLQLVATATTGSLLSAQLGLEIQRVASGPQGGDLEIGAMIVHGDVQAVVFFRDPLTAHPHEPDIQAVMKVCDVHDVPLATNRASAEMLLDGVAELVG